MTKQILIVGVVIASVMAMATVSTVDVPQLINYQGKLHDSAGNPLTGQYEIMFHIYDVKEG